MPSDWWSQESIQNSIARSLNTKARKASNCSHKTGLSTMSHASCVHELSIKLSWELLRIPENITSYLFSWNITQTTIVGTLNRKLLTDVMMLLKKIENKYFQNSPVLLKLWPIKIGCCTNIFISEGSKFLNPTFKLIFSEMFLCNNFISKKRRYLELNKILIKTESRHHFSTLGKKQKFEMLPL